MLPRRTLPEFCAFCHRTDIPDDMVSYLINSEGGYGYPEMWACADCMKAAEPDSIMGRKRDEAYAEDFHRPDA